MTNELESMRAEPGTDIVLTGLPRSGTTLACKLLSAAPQVLALHEPLSIGAIPTDTIAAAATVQRFFAEIRATVLSKGTAPSRLVNGEVPDSPFPEPSPDTLLRDMPADSARGTVAAPSNIRSGFTLVIKHPAAFTALLPELSQRLPCFAMVRNPVGVLASWSTCNAHFRRGRAPAAERFTPALAAALDAEPDPTSRQILLLEWFLKSFHEWLPRSRVLTYEALIASGGRGLSCIAGRPVPGRDSLAPRCRAYPPALVLALKQRLLRLPAQSPVWRYYRHDQVAGYE